MANFIATRLNPHWYHGKGKQAPFFEGWYYKLVTRDERRAFAIIPGAFIAKDPKETHAFIQVLDGTHGRARYHRIGRFIAAERDFDVTIGQSQFTSTRLVLNHEDDQGALHGELIFHDLTPFPVTLTSPGIMGWYGWLPFMECNHGIISIDHSIHGSLTLYGETIDFTGGRGYIEKDWGTNFPSAYIWMQSNHFQTPHMSLSCSIATIPNLGRTFNGFVVALLYGGRIYRFATYNRSKVDRLRTDDEVVEWVMYNRDYELALTAQRAASAPLKGPEKEAMHMRVDETLQATIHLRLSALDGFRRVPIVEDTGRNAGLEVVGEVERLLV
jgi:tocopherol cyclase